MNALEYAEPGSPEFGTAVGFWNTRCERDERQKPYPVPTRAKLVNGFAYHVQFEPDGEWVYVGMTLDNGSALT